MFEIAAVCFRQPKQSELVSSSTVCDLAMNNIEKATLQAIKQIKPDADLDDVASFIVTLAEHGHAVKLLTDDDLAEIKAKVIL